MTSVLPPNNIHRYSFDSKSTIERPEQYATGVRGRLVSGDLVFDNDAKSKLSNRVENRKGKRNSVAKPVKEFTVSRKSSFRAPDYYRLTRKPQPKHLKKKKMLSGFESPEQIEHVFKLNPKLSLTEYPAFMVEYFVGQLDLIKKDPIPQYQILKAKINIPIMDNLEEEKEEKENSKNFENKRRKHQSEPIPNHNILVSKQSAILNKLKRKSAPSRMQMKYEPVEMKIDEYLNQPLDIYKHKRANSAGSEAVLSFMTNLTRTSVPSQSTNQTAGTIQRSHKTHVSFKSNASSIDTTEFTQKNRLSVDSMLFHSRPNTEVLLTKRTDPAVRRSVQFENTIPIKSEINKSFEKHGVSPTPIEERHRSFSAKSPKRISHHADLSIESGSELYNSVKQDIFSKKFLNSNSMIEYLRESYPELADNDYFVKRLLFEIYLRRMLAARASVKLGTDAAKRGTDLWGGLKDAINSFYGSDQMSIFERQKY